MPEAPAELLALASSTIHTLFSSKSPTTPISAFDLLVRVITSTSATANPRFRLTDLALFEDILRALSISTAGGSSCDLNTRTNSPWPHGRIYITSDAKCVLDVKLGPPSESELAALNNASNSYYGTHMTLGKRKRVKDEEDDSAAEEDDEEDEPPKAGSTSAEQHRQGDGTAFGGLSQEMREAYAILQRGTAKGGLLAEEHQSEDKSFDPICPNITKDQCSRARLYNPSHNSGSKGICDRVHFRPLIRPHTDASLGHCSYLNTCYSEPTYAQSPSILPFNSRASGAAMNSAPNMRPVSLPSGLGAGGRGKEKAPCRYLHFEVDWDAGDGGPVSLEGSAPGVLEDKWKKGGKRAVHKLGIGRGPEKGLGKAYAPQWINCDLRRFDYSVLGKFHVIMADPPWDIHMSLPYGTMTDDEMRAMPIPTLQDEGFLFLWVTGRAMEVGRECLRVWGYTRVDEVIWVKTNQLQRVIRTGRTGHWLNHTKEHMLVGVKTNPSSPTGELTFPSWANRGLDTDVIVSEVRETSRKPDEVYGIIERMCPGGRKIEIFGRKHNTRPGWLTLGNQLGPDQIYEEDLKERIKARYPERTLSLPATPNW